MKSAFIALSAIAAAATAQDLSGMPQCAQTCGNNMMSASKAEELGCSANDLSCLCKNENFGYGFRDCAAAICSADEAMMLVQYAVKTCKDAGVEISPGAGGNGDDKDSDSDNDSSKSTGAGGEDGMGGAASTMYTTFTNSEGMPVTTPVATQTMGGDNDSDNEDGMNGGAGGAVTYTNSEGSVVVSSVTTMMPSGSMTTSGSGPMTTGGSDNDNNSDNNNDNDSDNNNDSDSDNNGGAGGSGSDSDSNTSTSSGLAAQATAQAGVLAAAGLAALLL